MSAQCRHNVRTMSALCPHNISRRIYVSRGRCCADIVRTYISRDIYPHYILLRFSAQAHRHGQARFHNEAVLQGQRFGHHYPRLQQQFRFIFSVSPGCYMYLPKRRLSSTLWLLLSSSLVIIYPALLV